MSSVKASKKPQKLTIKSLEHAVSLKAGKVFVDNVGGYKSYYYDVGTYGTTTSAPC